MKYLSILGLAALILIGVAATPTMVEDATVTRSDLELFTELDTIATATTSYVEWSDDLLKTGVANIGLHIKATDTFSVYIAHGYWTSTQTKRWHKGEKLYTANPTATEIDTVIQVPVRARGLRVYVTGDDGSAGVTTGLISIAVKPTND